MIFAKYCEKSGQKEDFGHYTVNVSVLSSCKFIIKAN